MPARLTVYPPDQPVQRFLLDPQHEYLIGRAAQCHLRLTDRRLSRTHACLHCRDDRWYLLDLGSKNGLQIDGHDVREAALQGGTWISFGGLLANFDLLTEEQLAADRQHAEVRWDSTVDLSRRLDPAAGLDRLLRQILQAVLQLADAERGFVMLADEQGRLVVRARTGRSEAAAAAVVGFSGSRGAVQQVLEQRRPVVVCDARASALLGQRPSVETGEIRALICLPLAVGEQVTGVIYLDSRLPGKVFTVLDVEILEAFAAHAALIIGVASVRSDLAGLAELLPAQMSRVPRADELVRRLQAALPRHASLATPDGNIA